MIRKVLIANRGEIAVRIIRACREMGILTVAVYSEADREALHAQLADEAVCIGPAPSKDSYLNMERILSAALVTGADAVHPGFGFLSENSTFARRCQECHITWIGPSPEVMDRLGNKSEARNTMQAAGVPVWGEVELAYRMSEGTVLAITGTNGKTTTTALLGEIMKAYTDSVFVVGNIGNPYTEAALSMTEDSYTVAEISSFQLETAHTFAPHVSAILNITEDHLNRHHTMAEYIRVKELIAANQTKDDYCILNYEDEELRGFGSRCPAKVVFFSSQRKLEEGVYLDGTSIVFKKEAEEIELVRTEELKLLGQHNYENVMAAAAMAYCAGVPREIIRKAASAFRAVAHRIEFVEEIDGVAYYNDSKGTNPDAAIKGIQAMNRPTLLIGGGYDKESSYEEWI
ncbi:MAG: UDP-N-acetylmuramoyl-L-alanine--D-glutamate ligase, partial [Blautia sp.]